MERREEEVRKIEYNNVSFQSAMLHVLRRPLYFIPNPWVLC